MIAFVGGCISITLIRKTLKKFLPTINENLFDWASIVLLILGLSVTTVNFLFDQKQIEALQYKVSLMGGDVDRILDYSEVATWNFYGSKSIGGGISVSSPIGNWHQGFVRNHEMNLSWQCNNEAISHYKLIIEKHPNYPFPYYLLAICLQKKGDDSWKILANKGISILENTTKISGHDPSHDDVLKRLRDLVSEKS